MQIDRKRLSRVAAKVGVLEKGFLRMKSDVSTQAKDVI